MTMMSEILDPVSLDHLAQHLRVIEKNAQPPRMRRSGPTLAACKAGPARPGCER